MRSGSSVRGRRISRILLGVGIGLVAITALLVVTEPSFIGPSSRMIDQRHVRVGLAAMAFALVWMIRIDRDARDPERRQSMWRSHR